MEIGAITIMAVGAHIGDAELTMGGTLATCSKKGGKIITVALTAGEKGVPAGRDIDEYKKQKINEARTFAEMLGGEAVVLKYNDGELPDNEEVRYELCDLIREYKPNLLLTHWKGTLHKDHELAHKIVLDAQFYAGVAGFQRAKPAHYAGGPYFAENWEDAPGYVPYIYMNITEGYELWLKAAATHEFVTKSASFKYLDYYDHLSFVRGCECRKERAETYMVGPYQMRI